MARTRRKTNVTSARLPKQPQRTPTSTTARTRLPELPLASLGRILITADVRDRFAELTKRTPRDEKAERLFLAGKLQMARTHPTDSLVSRHRLADLLAHDHHIVLQPDDAPVPGGVGYGMFFTDAFKTNWATATALWFDIVCPNPPGGNVNTYLYLTAMNRAARGVEAFVSYNGQNSTFFKVFDWARTDHWQTNISFASLGNYLRTASAHGNSYQVLTVANATIQDGANAWRNEVWLWNRSASRWDLTYQHNYTATLAQQQTGWVGSWGPIIETFQDLYLGTNHLGFLSTRFISRNASGQWGDWFLLGGSDSSIRVDNKGFCLVFNDPNHTWAAYS